MVTVREDNGRDWRLAVRHGQLNRGPTADDTNTVTPDRSRFSDIQLEARQQTSFGRVSVGVGYERFSNRGELGRDADDLRLSIGLQRSF